MNGKILIIEDDIAFGTMLEKWFQRNNFVSVWCSDMASAQEKLKQETYDIVLSDLRLPDGDGITLLHWMKEVQLNTPVVIMTGYGEVQTAVSAIKLGAFDFLEKPINPSILKQKIDSVFEMVSAKAKEEKQPKKITPTSETRVLVEGKSALASEMYTYINLVAPTQMAVMIIGESGTGKEHAARLIHDRSPRAAAPFIAVDCGSLSPELAPSELFGHKKGSFTSAIENKTGVFVEAKGGTLFLDEVGNLPYGVQMQLLRALQEKKVRPVGTATDMDVDVRIVTATNENLEKAIAGGTFREDLYHRLNEFMIQMPPLRECREDIQLYAEHFMREANAELDKQIDFISPEAMFLLENYSWKGNLRELRNVIRRAVLFSTGNVLTPEILPPLIEKPNACDESMKTAPLALTPEDEKQRILQALQRSGGNKSKAARLLGVDRKTLYNKIHQYNIDL